MPIITLPNGDQKQFDQAVSVMDVALSIGPGLAKNTVAGRVDGRLVDASDSDYRQMPAFKLLRLKTKKVSKSFVTLALTWWVMRLSNCSQKRKW